MRRPAVRTFFRPQEWERRFSGGEFSNQIVGEDHNPTWDELRFSGETVRRAFVRAGLGDCINLPPADALASIAEKVNRAMTDARNEAAGVFDNPPDFTHGIGITQDDIQGALRDQVMNAGARLYQAIERYADHGCLCPDSDLARIREMLLNMGAVHVREKERCGSGRPRAQWRETGKSVALWVGEALRQTGYDRSINANLPGGMVARVSAAIVTRIYGAEITADAFADAMRKMSRRRGKKSEFETRFPQLKRLLKSD